MQTPMHTLSRRLAIVLAGCLIALAIGAGIVWLVRPDTFGDLFATIDAWSARAWKDVETADPTKGPLGILVAVGGLVAAIDALYKWTKRSSPSAATAASGEPAAIRSATNPTVLPAEKSIAAYLDQLEATLNEMAARDRFVALRAESRGAPLPLPTLLQKFEQREATRAQPIDLLQAHKQFKQYVLLGAPGSGKSTCLKRLTLEMIRAYRNDPANEKIPLFASLANWTDKRLSAVEFLRQSVVRMTSPNNHLAVELDDYIANGALVVLLDGLNEMPNRAPSKQSPADDHQKSTKELAVGLATSGTLLAPRVDEREESVRELARNRGVRSHFVISCRTHEFAGSLDWNRIHILPMEADEIDQFLRLYLPNDHARVGEMLRRNDALFTLARNPFYLTLLTVVFERDLTEITTRGAFLELLLTTLLEREARRGQPVDIVRFEKTLGRLAFRMIARDMIGSQVDLHSVGVIEQSILDLGINTGLLTRNAEGGVVFYHQLVQEFFAALAIQRRFVRPSLKRLTRNQAWMETLVLYTDVARARPALIDRLVRLLRQRNGLILRPVRQPRLIVATVGLIVAFGFVIANLTIDAISGGGWLLTLVQQSPIEAAAIATGLPFALLFLVPSVGFHRVGIANTAYILSQIRSPELRDEIVPAIVEALSRVGISRKKLVDALVEIGDPAVEWLLAGLRSRRPNTRRGCIEALGRLRAPQALEPLIQIVENGDEQCFIQAAQALAQFDDPRGTAAVAQSLDAIESGVRIMMGIGIWFNAFAQARRVDDAMITRLAERAGKEQPHLRRSLAIAALGALRNAAALPTLAAIGRDAGDPLRGDALKQLANLDSPLVVTTLVDIDVHSDTWGPSAAVSALRKVRSPATRDELVSLLDHKYWWIRDAALESLGRMQDPAAVSAILARLNQLRRESAAEVAMALGRIGSPDAFDGLAALARDPREQVREAALFALDHRFAARSGSLFLEFLKDPMYPDRQAVLELLVNAPPPGDEFKKTLVSLQHDRDERLVQSVVTALDRMNYGLEKRLKQIGVSLGVGRARSVARVVVAWTGWPEYLRMNQEFQLASELEGSAAGIEAGLKIGEMTQRDPDLQRRLRPITRLLALGFIIAIALIGALPVFLWRSMGGLAVLAVHYWPWTLGVAGAAILTYVRGFRWLGRVRFVGVALRTALVVLALAFAIRYVPSAMGGSLSWLRDATIASGTQLLAHWRWIAGLVSAAIVLLLARNRGPTALQVLVRIIQMAALLALVVLAARLVMIHWIIAVGLVGSAMVLRYLAFRRATMTRRRQRMQEAALARTHPVLESPVIDNSNVAGTGV